MPLMPWESRGGEGSSERAVRNTAMTFKFRFESMLRFRQRQKDVQQQAALKVRRDHEQCLQRRNDVLRERTNVLEEIRQLNDGGSLAIGMLVDRQRHADQLSREFAIAERDLVQAKSCLDASLE